MSSTHHNPLYKPAAGHSESDTPWSPTRTAKRKFVRHSRKPRRFPGDNLRIRLLIIGKINFTGKESCVINPVPSYK